MAINRTYYPHIPWRKCDACGHLARGVHVCEQRVDASRPFPFLAVDYDNLERRAWAEAIGKRVHEILAKDKAPMIKTKTFEDHYNLTYTTGKLEITFLDSIKSLGRVRARPGEDPRLELNVAALKRTVIDAAFDFFEECEREREREALSTFKCEVKFEFEMREDLGRVLVKERGLVTGHVMPRDSSPYLAPAVVAAARKFAGWDA